MPTRHGTLLTLLTAALLLLAACADDNNLRGGMPTGYTYHDDLYKAPPGPEIEMSWWEKRKHALRAWRSNDEEPDPSVMVGDINSALPPPDMMPQGMAQGWDSAASALVGEIIASFGQQVGTVRLVAADGIAPEMASAFEGAIRRTLLNQGIGAEQGPHVLRYYARPTGSGAMTGDTFLLLNLSLNGQTLSEKSGFFTVGTPSPMPAPEDAYGIPSSESGVPMMLTP